MVDEAPVIAPIEPIIAPAPVAETPAVPAPETPVDGEAPVAEAPIAPTAGASPAALETEAPKPESNKKTPAYQRRIDQLVREKGDKDRALEAKDRELALYKALAEGKAPPVDGSEPIPQNQPGMVPVADVEKIVEQRAAQLAAKTQYETKAASLLEKGNEAFGAKGFAEKCNEVANLGAGDKPEFMQIITDIPDGHKVIDFMAENPEEAMRILSLPPLRMSAEIGKVSVKLATPVPKTISSAPRPITPIDGTAKGNDDPQDTDDIKTWMAKRNKQQHEKGKLVGAKF